MRPWGNAAVIAAAVLVGVTAGVTVAAGGLFQEQESSVSAGPAHGSEANSGAPSPTPSPTPEAPPTEGLVGSLPAGTARADNGAADLRSPVLASQSQTRDGAVEAFASLATWLLASRAAAEEPQLAIEEVGGGLLNVADAQTLLARGTSPDDDVDPAAGAYRVLGHSGPREAPDQVMLEIAAPATFGTGTRWLVVGGVVAWSAEGWQLRSIAPREIPQPSDPDAAAGRLTAGQLSTEDQARVFPDLGWRLFANPSID